MLFEDEWRTTWDQLELIDLEGDGEHELLAFDSSRDDFWIHNLTRAGTVGARIYESDWAGAWTHIEAGNLDTEPGDELFIYSATGRVRIHDLTSNGVGSMLSEYEWRGTWDQIELIDLEGDGEDELLLFDSSQGDFRIHNLTRAGTVGARIHEDTWTREWTHIEAGNMGQDPGDELFLYSANGQVRIQEPQEAVSEPNFNLDINVPLSAGESLYSSNESCRLDFQPDGNIVIYNSSDEDQWSTETWQTTTNRLIMQDDGNLVARDNAGTPTWNSETWQNPGATAELGNDCVLRVTAKDGRLLWDSKYQNAGPNGDTLGSGNRMTIGQSLVSGNGNCRVEFRGDQQWVITNLDTGAASSSQTANSGADDFIMQPNGNLVLYKPGGDAVWSSDTQGNGATATIGNDCILRVNDGNGELLWDNKNGKPAPPPPAPAPAPRRAFLNEGHRLNLGQSLWSTNGRCELALQPDGNLVIYRDGRSPENVVWSPYVANQGGHFLEMEGDGNLVLYKSDGRTDVWDSETDWDKGIKAILEDDCVLRLRTTAFNTLWWDTLSGESPIARNNGVPPTATAPTPASAPSPISGGDSPDSSANESQSVSTRTFRPAYPTFSCSVGDTLCPDWWPLVVGVSPYDTPDSYWGFNERGHCNSSDEEKLRAVGLAVSLPEVAIVNSFLLSEGTAGELYYNAFFEVNGYENLNVYQTCLNGWLWEISVLATPVTITVHCSQTAISNSNLPLLESCYGQGRLGWEPGHVNCHKTERTLWFDSTDCSWSRGVDAPLGV